MFSISIRRQFATPEELVDRHIMHLDHCKENLMGQMSQKLKFDLIPFDVLTRFSP